MPYYPSRLLKEYQIFVQCDSDLMLARRLRRDVKERGRQVDGILDQLRAHLSCPSPTDTYLKVSPVCKARV